MASKRILWIDAVKGFAIIAVVLGHVLLGFEQNNSFPDYYNSIHFVKLWIYSWHMPLFIFISGITFKMSCYKDNKWNFEKIKKNTLNLLILYVVFASILPTLKFIFSSFVNHPVKLNEILFRILLPNNLMWYLWVMIIYYAVFPLILKKVVFKIPIFALLLCISCLVYYLYSIEMFNELAIKKLFYCSVYFYLGLNIESLADAINKKIMIIACMLNGIFIAYEYVVVSLKWFNNDAANIMFYQINAFAEIILAFFIFKTFFNKELKLCYIGKQSLIIYLIHTYLVTIMRNVVVRLNFNVIIAIITCTIIPLILCIGLAIWSDHCSLLNYVFKPILLFDKKKST